MWKFRNKMKNRINIKDCIDNSFLIETGDKDVNKAQELFKMANHRLEFWNKAENHAKLYPSLFIEGYYEIIKELFLSILCLDGWKATNHECLFAYISTKYSTKIEVDYNFLLELKDTRNSINYRGVMLSKNRWLDNQLKIKLTVKAFKRYVYERLN